MAGRPSKVIPRGASLNGFKLKRQPDSTGLGILQIQAEGKTRARQIHECRSVIPRCMGGVIYRYLYTLIAFLLAAASPLCAQQAPENFRWVDFHSAKDQDTIVWVTRSLVVEDWTAIREIGVQYDTALVVTNKRATPQSSANADTFTIWNVSLTNHGITPLIKGVNLRWLDWMRFADSAPEELALLYDNCRDCAANTYFTAFHYDVTQHGFAARWMHGGQGVPVWSENTPAGVAWTQVYTGVAEPNGRELLYTWNHFDYGKPRPPDDYIYRYDLDPFSGLERTLTLSGKDADAVKVRICRGQDAVPGLQRGQDSALCQQLVGPRIERRPVTSPPANNRGQSAPPGGRR